MNKFPAVRPIVLGVIKKENKLLVSRGYDSLKKQYFYRCLGGGIEFQETSETALKREFQEEISKDITVKDFLGIAENIFTFDGKPGHEIVFFYSADLKEEDYKEEYIMDENGKKDKAIWVDIEKFKSKELIIYPTEILKYL